MSSEKRLTLLEKENKELKKALKELKEELRLIKSSLKQEVHYHYHYDKKDDSLKPPFEITCKPNSTGDPFARPHFTDYTTGKPVPNIGPSTTEPLGPTMTSNKTTLKFDSKV